MGSKKNVNMSDTPSEVKEVKHIELTADANTDGQSEMTSEVTPTAAEVKKAKKAHQRGHKYNLVRSQVDKTKMYDTFAAIEMLKKLSYTKFDGTITAHAVLRDEGISANVTFPHSTGKAIRVAIVSDELISQIEAGTLDFDVLVTSPQFMPKLARLARVLGPKGLMPNPKNGTITDNPERKKQELEGGQVTLKSEKKAPLMHVNIGKVSMATKDLVENLNALTDALKGRLLKLSVAASMSPSIKVLTD